MSLFGTDMVALGCILGGAAVGGVATLAMTNVGGHADARCAVETMAVSPRIAISHGGDTGAILVAPKVRVRAVRDCMTEVDGVVEIHMENHLEDLNLHMGHLDVQLDHLDRALEMELHQLESQLEAEMGQMEARIHFEEAMRQLEEARVKVVVKRVEGGGN